MEPGPGYHVFLSHASPDKPRVEELATRLIQAGLRPWLDKWHLVPGEPWQPAIEAALADCATCAVFIGAAGIGTWQNEEMRHAIDRRVAEGDGRFRVIPVLLPGAERPQRSKLPAFLVATTWVEFRDTLDDPDAFHRLVSGVRGDKPGTGPGQDGAPFAGQCPYRGLEHFDVEHSALFFGREALTEWLIDALRHKPSGAEDRFLAIIGASGSGKSSLARAGLLAGLRDGKLNGSASWPRAICRPGADPFLSLATALATVAPQSVAGVVFDRLLGRKDGDRSLHVAANLALGEPPTAARLVVLVDQFEEVFTLCTDDAVRRELLANLLHASTTAGGRTVVVQAMRADFYPRCAAYTDLAAALSDHQVLVGPMSGDELREAIERPALLAGLEPEPGLVDLLVDDVHGRPGALPLLQFALQEIWQRRYGHRLTIRAYRDIGQIEGALRRKADAVFESFTSEQKELCRRIFLRLVQPGEGTEDTRRLARLRELVPTGGDAGAVQAIVDRLVDARLVITGNDRGGTMIEMAHEALVRDWSQLRNWVDSDRAGLRIHRRLTEAAADWVNEGRKPSLLYTGAWLAGALEWAESHANELNPWEDEFLRESAEADQRKQAREIAAAKEAARLARRRARVLATLLSVTAILFAIAAVALYYATYERSLAQQALYEANIRLAHEELLGNEFRSAWGRAREYLDDPSLRRQAGTRPGVNGWEWRLLRYHDQSPFPLAQGTGPPSATGGAPGKATQMTIDRNNQFLAGAFTDGSIKVWTLPLGGFKDAIPAHKGPAHCVDFAVGSRLLASGGEDGAVRIWQVDPDAPRHKPGTAWSTAGAYETLRLEGNEAPVLSVSFNRNGDLLASGSQDGTVRYWKVKAVERGEPGMHVLDRFDSPVRSVVFHSGGALVAVGADGTVKVWGDVLGPPQVVEARGSRPTTRAAFPLANPLLAVSDGEGWIRLWNVKDRTSTSMFQAHDGGVSGLVYSDSHTLISCGEDGLVKVWRVPGIELLDSYRVHRGPVRTVACSTDGRFLVSGGDDGRLNLWGRPRDGVGDRVGRHAGYCEALGFSSDGRFLATGGGAGDVRVWDTATGAKLFDSAVGIGTISIRSVAFTSDSRVLLAATSRGFTDVEGGRAGNEGMILAWDTGTWTRIRRLSAPTIGGFEGLALSPDDRWVAARDPRHASSSIELWDVTKRKAVELRKAHPLYISSLAFSPDARFLASGSADETAILWDLATYKPVWTLRGHGSQVRCIAFSRDGRTIATGSADNRIRVWDVATGRFRKALVGHTARVQSLVFHPDGSRLFSCGDDGYVRVWDFVGGRELLKLHEFKAQATRVAISPDGRLLAACDNAGEVRWWVVNERK